MRRLDASRNELEDVDAIAALPSLSWLSLANNALTSAEPLRACASLEVLNLAHNRIAGKVQVGRLTRLKALVLNNNAVTLVGGLERCRQLNTLILSHNRLESVQGWLAGAAALAKLQLSHNALAELPGAAVAGLDCLAELRVNYNRLEALPQELSRLTRLRILEAGANPIARLEDVQVLAALPALRQLSLKGCPVSELPGYRETILKWLPRLQAREGVGRMGCASRA